MNGEVLDSALFYYFYRQNKKLITTYQDGINN